MDYPMTDVIATRDMIRTRPDGVQTTVTIQIGAPAPTPPGSVFNGWYCPIRFQGLPIQPAIYGLGGGSAEALIYALTLPVAILRAMPFAHELNYSSLPTFGFPEFPPVLPPGATISGTVQQEACNDAAQNITFEFRPTDGSAETVIHQILTPLTADSDTGSFSIPGVPDGTYDLAIKGFCWLRKVITAVVVNGSHVFGLSVFLPGGDMNNDNVCDATDFGLFVSDYGTQGDP